MDFRELVHLRRSYRKLDQIEIKPEMIKDLMNVVQLAPSCENTQPWRFVFVYDQDKLAKVKDTFDERNNWAKNASLLVGVFSNPNFDCQISQRRYYLFDTGIATSYLILQATEYGLTAHPISYFDEQKAKQALDIPPEMELITIIVIGKHSDSADVKLNTEQEKSELERPRRFSMQYLSYLNNYIKEYEENKQKYSSIFEKA